MKLNTCCQPSNAAELRFKQTSERDTPQKRRVVFGRCLSVWDSVFQGAKLLLVSVSRKHLKKKNFPPSFQDISTQTHQLFQNSVLQLSHQKIAKNAEMHFLISFQEMCDLSALALVRVDENGVGRMMVKGPSCLEKWMVYVASVIVLFGKISSLMNGVCLSTWGVPSGRLTTCWGVWDDHPPKATLRLGDLTKILCSGSTPQGITQHIKTSNMLDDWELWCGLSGILVVTPFLVWLQGSSLESHLCTSWIEYIYIYIYI